MTIPENDETYLDRLLTSEQAAGLPHILNLDPDVNVRTIDQRYLQDAYNYYLGGGRDAAQADFPIQASGITTQVPATTDLGTGEGRTGITATGVATPVVAPFMETSPNVLSAVDNTGQPISGNIVDPTTGDIYAPGDYADVAGTLTDPREKIDTLADTGGRDIPDVRQYADRSWNVDYEALDQEGQAEIDQAYTDLYGIDYTQNTEAQNAWQRVQSGLQSAGDFVRDWGQTAAEKFNELTGNTIDLGRALAGGVTSLVTGIPVIPGLIASQMETPNPYQQKVKEQYEAEGVTLDDLGRVVQTGVYDTPENVMAGYATGPTGVILGGKTIGGKTIQESVVDRLETLEKTKNEKYGGSFYNADGSPKINPDTGKPTTLGDREEALKENLNIVARAAGADTVTEYDPKSKTAGITLGPSEYGFLTDPDELVTAEDLAREQRDEAIEAGIAAADEDAGMLDIAKDTEYDTADFGMTTTGINPFEETQQKTTALDLAKGQPVYNETTGNWEDIDGNIIEDPKKTETDIALASDRYEGRTGIEFVNPAFSNYRTPMLDKIINPKTEKEKRESKELLDGMKDIYGPDWEKKMREEFKNREKKYGPLPEDVELKKHLS